MNFGFTAWGPSVRRLTIRLQAPTTVPSEAEPLVGAARNRDGATAVLVGSLFYRDDLLARLPGHEASKNASDAALALLTYCHLGRNGLESLEGEFALLVWEPKAARLVAMRDPLGSYPLYWQAAGEGLAVSTSLKALRDMRPWTLNLDYLAEFLVTPFPRSELPCTDTVYQGIRRVEPGTIMEFGENGQPQRCAYWDWSTRIAPIAEKTPQAAGERFQSLFRAAVRERLRPGPAVAHLSGGMDSSAVTCVARDHLVSQQAAGPLATISLVFKRPSLAGERAYIDLVLGQGGAIEPYFVAGDAVVDFQWFDEELPYHDEPFNGLRALATHRAFAQAAGDAGRAVMLTGFGADEFLDNSPYHLADLVRRGRWLAALKEAHAWAFAWNQGLWSVLRPFGLEPLAPVFFREGFKVWRRGGVGVWPKLGWFCIPPWLKSDFVRGHKLRDRCRAHACRFFGAPSARSEEMANVQSSVGDWARWFVAAPRGLRLSHPFRDPRLMAYGLSVPRAWRLMPGRRKPLLQEAMRGVLPEPIRIRREKRGFDDLYALGLSRNQPRLESMVRQSAIGDLGILDKAQLLDVMRQAAMGIGDAPSRARMESTLALIAWLDMATTSTSPMARSKSSARARSTAT